MLCCKVETNRLQLRGANKSRKNGFGGLRRPLWRLRSGVWSGWRLDLDSRLNGDGAACQAACNTPRARLYPSNIPSKTLTPPNASTTKIPRIISALERRSLNLQQAPTSIHQSRNRISGWQLSFSKYAHGAEVNYKLLQMVIQHQ